MAPSLYLFLALAVFFLGLFFPLVIAVVGEISGWRRLAERYPLPGEAPPPTHKFQSLRLNIGSYRRVLQMAETPQGVYLEPMSLFRLNHPPLFLPWTEILLEEHPTWWGWYLARLRSSPGEVLYLPPSVRQRWLQYLPPSRP